MTASKGKLSESDGRKLFQQLIDGVTYCHDKGVYHCNLKVINHILSCPTITSRRRHHSSRQNSGGGGGCEDKLLDQPLRSNSNVHWCT
ncbi:hypothetical protein L1987_87215 [Smallanthus sonchifolius]|nr:hypothetical protein L1987_87215 [Smallanthus sonchifolius]